MRSRILPLVLFASVLAAQPGPGRGGRWFVDGGGTDALKSALNLTDDQITKLRELRKTEFDAVKAVLDKLRDNREALKAQVDKGTDANAIGNLVLAGKALREQLRQSNESYHKQAVALLNPTQQEALKKLQDATKLIPAVGQARALNLLERPEEDEGWLGMMRMRGGEPGDFAPQGFGPRRLRR
jgi:Spy/CpxP family protein refolding chaperone